LVVACGVEGEVAEDSPVAALMMVMLRSDQDQHAGWVLDAADADVVQAAVDTQGD